MKYGKVPSRIMHNVGLSLQARAVYAILSTFANREGICWPTVKTLSELSGVSRRTMHRLLNELEKKKYIKREGKFFELKS